MTDLNLTLSSIVAVAGAISILSGSYLRLKRIHRERSEQKQLEKALIIQEAKEISNKHRLALETKLEHLESELNAKIEHLSHKINNIDESFTKDLEHVKEAYNSEIRFLGSKIEELKDEMRQQMNQVVVLVSKLIDKT